MSCAPTYAAPSTQDLIDEYYAACQDGQYTNDLGEVQEWNEIGAPQVKALAEACGCAAAAVPGPSASLLWLALAAVAQHVLPH